MNGEGWRLFLTMFESTKEGNSERGYERSVDWKEGVLWLQIWVGNGISHDCGIVEELHARFYALFDVLKLLRQPVRGRKDHKNGYIHLRIFDAMYYKGSCPCPTLWHCAEEIT